MDVEDLYGSIQIPCQWIDSHEISISIQEGNTGSRISVTTAGNSSYFGDALWHHQSGFQMSQKDQQLQTYSHQASPTIGYITPDPYPKEQQK